MRTAGLSKRDASDRTRTSRTRQFQGSWWQARCAEAITLVPGTIVYVVDRRNVTRLYVKPATNVPMSHPGQIVRVDSP